MALNPFKIRKKLCQIVPEKEKSACFASKTLKNSNVSPCVSSTLFFMDFSIKLKQMVVSLEIGNYISVIYGGKANLSLERKKLVSCIY